MSLVSVHLSLPHLPQPVSSLPVIASKLVLKSECNGACKCLADSFTKGVNAFGQLQTQSKIPI